MDKFEYIGLFLTKESKDKLLSVLPLFDGKVYLDHLTLLHKSQLNDKRRHLINNIIARFEIDESYVNSNDGPCLHEITITHIGWNDKAMAFKVTLPEYSYIVCMNNNPHITIQTFGDGKPVDSNNIDKWLEIKSITIETKLEKR